MLFVSLLSLALFAATGVSPPPAVASASPSDQIPIDDPQTPAAPQASEADRKVAEEPFQPLPVVKPLVREIPLHDLLTPLRYADAMVTCGRLDEANGLYGALVEGESVPREILIEAAIGLYRTGAFSESLEAFRKIGPLGIGEEDLRYYRAISLLETGDGGDHACAERELACVLPLIQLPDAPACDTYGDPLLDPDIRASLAAAGQLLNPLVLPSEQPRAADSQQCDDTCNILSRPRTPPEIIASPDHNPPQPNPAPNKPSPPIDELETQHAVQTGEAPPPPRW